MPIVKVEYNYNISNISALELLLSTPRLSTYIRASEEGNKEQALNLYIWNARISTSLHWPLQVVEISLRNAIDLRMCEKFGNSWIDPSTTPLNSGAVRKIEEAQMQISRDGKAISKDRLVASLSMGFWTTLLGNGGREVDYHNKLWTPALHKAFKKSPHNNNRKKIQRVFLDVKTLRNRIAHHEPIFRRDLENEYLNILDTIRWQCSETANWVEAHSDFYSVYAEKPKSS